MLLPALACGARLGQGCAPSQPTKSTTLGLGLILPYTAHHLERTTFPTSPRSPPRGFKPGIEGRLSKGNGSANNTLSRCASLRQGGRRSQPTKSGTVSLSLSCLTQHIPPNASFHALAAPLPERKFQVCSHFAGAFWRRTKVQKKRAAFSRCVLHASHALERRAGHPCSCCLSCLTHHATSNAPSHHPLPRRWPSG